MEDYKEFAKRLEEALVNSWSKTTSSEPDSWDEENPAYGQCAVTTAVVQDYLGGRIEWRSILIEDNSEFEDYFDEGEMVSHYINRVDGHNMDFTEEQFPYEHAVLFLPEEYHEKMEGFENVRDYLLFSDSTYRRYRALKDRVDSYLEKGRLLELT